MTMDIFIVSPHLRLDESPAETSLSVQLTPEVRAALALGRIAAYDVVKAASQRARTGGKMLAEEVAAAPEVAGRISRQDLERLLDPAKHTGLSRELTELACVEAERSLKG